MAETFLDFVWDETVGGWVPFSQSAISVARNQVFPRDIVEMPNARRLSQFGLEVLRIPAKSWEAEGNKGQFTPVAPISPSEEPDTKLKIEDIISIVPNAAAAYERWRTSENPLQIGQPGQTAAREGLITSTGARRGKPGFAQNIKSFVGGLFKGGAVEVELDAPLPGDPTYGGVLATSAASPMQDLLGGGRLTTQPRVNTRVTGGARITGPGVTAAPSPTPTVTPSTTPIASRTQAEVASTTTTTPGTAATTATGGMSNTAMDVSGGVPSGYGATPGGVTEPQDVFYQLSIDPMGRTNVVAVNQDDAINQFFRRTPSQIKAIQEQFIRAGYKNIQATGRLDSPDQVDAYTKAVTDALSSYSNLVQRAPNAAPSNIGIFIDNAANQAGGGKPSTSVYETLYVTSEADATRYFNQLYLEYTGSAPTPKQAKEFAKRLNAMERQNVQRQVTTTGEGFSRTTVTRGGVDEVDKEQIALDLIGKVVTPEGLGQVSGQLGQNLRNIDQTLAAYNVNIDPETRREYLLNSVRSKNGLNDVIGRIQNLSALQNPALAPYIQQGYKPQEVLGGYKQFKASLTGLPATPGLWDDPDIAWLAKQPSLLGFDPFRIKVLDRPEADYYPEQRKQAASYALNMLDIWGFR